MKLHILSFLLLISAKSLAIDIVKFSFFDPKILLGKTIIIPTYNGGDSKLNFAYNTNILKTKRLDYKNISNTVVLGRPITITNYQVLNQNKKDEIFCLIADVDGEHVVLAFPMRIDESDYTGKLIADLFYSNGKYTPNFFKVIETYTIKDINLHYYIVDEINKFNEEFLDKYVFLAGNDEIASNREYKFSGFEFLKGDKEFEGKERQFRVVSSYYVNKRKKNTIDEMFAILKGSKDVYVKIKENDKQPFNENSVAFTGLKKLILSECDYKNNFKMSINQTLYDSIRNIAAEKKEYYVHGIDKEGILLSKTSDFGQYKTTNLSMLGDHYMVFNDVQQVKTIDSKGSIQYNYYLLGKGTDENVFEDHIAIPLNFDITKCLEDGISHREMVKIEEQKRDSINRERIAQLDREEREYKSSLIKKYGQANARLILNGEVRIGFSKAMCNEAWGEPDYINRTTSAYRNWEQWVYGIGSYLYFEGDKLVVIQN